MRKIVVSEFMSLDGVMEGPGPDDPFEHAGWTMPYGNAEFMKFKLDELLASGALLLGRMTYEGFAAAWPGRSDEMGFADKINTMPKYVVSRTLKTSDWENTHIIMDDLADEVRKLREEPGRDILVNGSAVLVRTLLEHGLVDELRLLVYPVVLGTGKQLFVDAPKTSLKLVSTTTFETGVVLLTYKPDEK